MLTSWGLSQSILSKAGFFSNFSSYKGERLTRTSGLLTCVVKEIEKQLIERSLPADDFRIYISGEPVGHNTTPREIYRSLRAAVENSWLFVGTASAH